MVVKKKEQTPLMQQHEAIKQAYPGTLLLFQVGDFYETFREDAHKLHEITGIKLTKRSNGAASSVALAGFPHHALDIYLPKLVKAGLRVAICDQKEAPQQGKTIVERKVRELVTPGITYHDHVLDHRNNNYLASLHFAKQGVGIALLDISTGEFLTTQGSTQYITKLIQNFRPAEIIFNKKDVAFFQELLDDDYHHYMLEDWIYSETYAYKRLNEHFGTTTLKGFGIEALPLGIVAAGAVLRYLEETEQSHLQHINAISRIQHERYMWLDKFTIRNLELLQPQQEEGVPLIDVLDKTITPMGARRIKKWLLLPLKEAKEINERLDCVSFFLEEKVLGTTISEHLKEVGDLERLISKVASRRIAPRELQALKRALEQVAPLKEALQDKGDHVITTLYQALDPCFEIIEKIDKTLQEQLSGQSTQGEGLIRAGISPELDELRGIAFEGNAHLQKIQDEERKKRGISSLKVGYNKVFGYYLEVTHTHKDKVPSSWIRKQTLVNAERYITEELKRYEEQILHAQERIASLERSLYQQLVEDTARFVYQIQRNAQAISHLDCYHALATVSAQYGYVRPDICESGSIDIEAGRHPVIERYLPVGKSYVPNDTLLDDKQQILLITGPNMAGKSALLRQVALIVLMAQIGSFVPAKKARIAVVDRLFTRVGASDNVAKQESTFMVEMNEMASILNNLSERSLLIVDELGRGTGTSDGLALAQSIITYLHNHPKWRAKTLFATHYHELNALAKHLPKVKNYKVVVKEIEDQVLFLHKLVAGGCQHSFGIQVAHMAGIPKPIIDDAFRLIKSFNKSQGKKKPLVPLLFDNLEGKQGIVATPSPRDKFLPPLLEALKKVDVNTLAPVEALLRLQELSILAAPLLRE